VTTAGIRVANASTVPIFIKAGAYTSSDLTTNSVVWDSADNFIAYWVTTSDTTPEYGLFNIRLVGTGVTTAEQILAMEVQARTTGTAICRGIEAHAVFPLTSTARSGRSCGLYARVASASGATLTGETYAGYFYTQLAADTVGISAGILIECNSTTNSYDDFFIRMLGAPNFAFGFDAEGTVCASASGTPGTGAGWIKVQIGGSTRWIQLYSVAP